MNLEGAVLFGFTESSQIPQPVQLTRSGELVVAGAPGGSSAPLYVVPIASGGSPTSLVNAGSWNDAQLPTNELVSVAELIAYRGTTGNTWDRVRSLTPDTLGGAASAQGVLAVGQLAQWTIEAHPAAGGAASATKAAAGAGIRHVAVGGIASLAAGAAAAGIVNVFLRDGAAGVGAIIASAVLTAPVNGLAVFAFGPTAIRGTAATAMTWELAAAGGAAVQSAVTLWGYDVTN